VQLHQSNVPTLLFLDPPYKYVVCLDFWLGILPLVPICVHGFYNIETGCGLTGTTDKHFVARRGSYLVLEIFLAALFACTSCKIFAL